MNQHFFNFIKSTLHVIFIFTIAMAAVIAHAQENNNPIPEIVKVRAKGLGTFGGDVDIQTHVFKPNGAGPFPVLLFSHGRSGDQSERANLKNPLAFGHVRFWLNKGYAVVAPVRIGYGETGGADREGAGAKYDANGTCISRPDPANTAKYAMLSTEFVLQWVREQAWANKDRILLEGQSVGGLTTIALCAQNPPGVMGCINFAGGAGGSPASKGNMCHPEILGQMMAQYGASTKLPNIWFYAENDMYWGPESPKIWHKNFAEGGSASQFVATNPVPNADGHSLLLRGGTLWSLPLNAWLKKNNF
ncbi:MAG TPA: CocE/NonD family hydrolase [Burkholderiaceae bacterium]|nr:CocE/NonD family hydrolase [Burkholderiaceae bacterium]